MIFKDFFESRNVGFEKNKHNIVFTIIVTILLIVFLLISLLIWPYIYQASAVPDYREGSVNILWMGGIVCFALISIAVLLNLFTKGNFSYSRTFALLVLLSGLTFGIWMTTANLSLIILVADTFIGQFMTLLLRIILATCMSIIPSTIALGIAYVIRAILLMRERIREKKMIQK